MVTITLMPELEQAITERAKQQGTTPELLVLDTLNEQFLPALPSVPSQADNLADYLGEFIGCLDSGELVPGETRMSESGFAQAAAYVLQKNAELYERLAYLEC